MTQQEQPKKKLIEVSLPLETINKASSREKSIRHGHPSTLHLWWSRKPLAACRAILFASLVDDPSQDPERFRTEEAQEQERQRLFGIIEELITWENSQNDVVLKKALDAIHKKNQPPIRDPFCGGGSIPLEALRLALQARSSDLNPVAVLITEALIEIPPKFAGRPPVAHTTKQRQPLIEDGWQGAQGLAEDIRYYGKWMRDEAEKRIGHIYPKVTLPTEYGGSEATVVAWLWARTVTCPNPACGACMPLTHTWWLSKKKSKETWIEPLINTGTQPPNVHFVVKQGQQGPLQEGTVNRRGAQCIVCGTPVHFDHVRGEGKAGRMGGQLMAIIAEGQGGRIYCSPNETHTMTATEAYPKWSPDAALPRNPRDFKTPNYGICTFGDLFTSRQLTALNTFADLVQEVREHVLINTQETMFPDDKRPLWESGTGVVAYADAIATYLLTS